MKNYTIAPLLLLLACLLLTACGPGGMSGDGPVPFDLNLGKAEQPDAPVDDGNLVIWSDIPLAEEMIREFEKANPGVHVDVQEKSLETQLEEYMQAMIDHTPVDVFVMDSSFLGKFSTLQGFEDLSGAPYGAERYREGVPEKVWGNHLSVKDDALFALPVALSPSVLYYRADLIEKYGFPSEPEALAVYLESEENLLALAEGMKPHGHSIFFWYTYIVDLYISQYGFLDDYLEHNIPKEDVLHSIELMSEIMQEQYVVNKDFWTPDGQRAIRNDEIIMLFLGSWGEKYLPEFAPDQSGAWRVTRMPFDLYGWSSSTALAIPSHSGKKELAWKFIEFTMEQGLDFEEWPLVPAYEPVRTEEWRREQANPYFGNQKTYALYENLIEKTDAHELSPFDDELYPLLYEILYRGMEQKLEAEEIYKNFTNAVNENYSEEMEMLHNR